MAKNTTTATEAKPGPIERLKNFLQEVRAELNKVTWPTMEDLQVSTKVTLFLLGVMAIIIFGFDQVFQFVVLMLLNLTT